MPAYVWLVSLTTFVQAPVFRKVLFVRSLLLSWRQSSWGDPGGVYLVALRGFWALLGPLGLSRPLLASLGALLGLSWGSLGAFLALLASLWGSLGLSWGSLGALLGLSWPLWGLS